MGFWRLLEVASMPILQLLLISLLGAFMATDYLGLLNVDARKSLNKIVFVAFTPSLMFASLAKTVTFEYMISWWFMPINVGMTFLFGGILGWIAVKVLKPKPHLEGLIIATCSAGNLGNLLLIVIPAICKKDGSPFGDHNVCSSVGLSYSSFSMAIGGFYIWTYTYQLIRTSSERYKEMKEAETILRQYSGKHSNEKSPFLRGEEDDIGDQEQADAYILLPSPKDNIPKTAAENNIAPFWVKFIGVLHQILKEVRTPPTLAAIIGLIFGAIAWLKMLLVGENAPLRVIQDSIELLGEGTIPCITLILGGNLTSGLREAKPKPMIIIVVICVRYILLPTIGFGVVTAANHLGFLPSDPLFHFILMIQYTLPPAMNIGTMTQLFDVAQAECSILFLWTYVVATISLTVWSTVFMWILS